MWESVFIFYRIIKTAILMNIKKIISIAVLPALWFLYVLFELFTHRISDWQTIGFNVILMIIFAFAGLIIYNISLKYEKGFKSSTIFMLVCFTFALDQIPKIIIKFFFFNKNIEIIKNMLFFSPIINTHGSWMNARFGTAISFPVLISLNIIALILFLEIYRYYTHLEKKDFWCDAAFIFVFTGAFCSLIDKVFYGGSLDFIGISDLFIADIKDIYINIGILLIIVALYSSGYLTSDDESTFKDDLKQIKKFLIFIKNDIKQIFIKNK